jgi:hypothetical protein
MTTNMRPEPANWRPVLAMGALRQAQRAFSALGKILTRTRRPDSMPSLPK